MKERAFGGEHGRAESLVAAVVGANRICSPVNRRFCSPSGHYRRPSPCHNPSVDVGALFLASTFLAPDVLYVRPSPPK